MKTERIIFDPDEKAYREAMQYLRTLSDIFSVNLMSKLLQINRTTLTLSLYSTPDKTEKPKELPQKHRQKVIKFVQLIQFDSVMKMLADNGSGKKFSELIENINV